MGSAWDARQQSRLRLVTVGSAWAQDQVVRRPWMVSSVLASSPAGWGQPGRRRRPWRKDRRLVPARTTAPLDRSCNAGRTRRPGPEELRLCHPSPVAGGARGGVSPRWAR